MKKIFGKLLICIPFLLVIFGIGIGTIYRSRSGIIEITTQSFANKTIFDTTKTENLLKDNLLKKDLLIECSGITQKLLGRNLVGNGEFYQDNDRIMHLKREYRPEEKLIESTTTLGRILSERSIPFLVCQIAERAAYGDSSSKLIDGVSLNYMEPLKHTVNEIGAMYFDYSQVLIEGGLTAEEIFFKTDLHYTTEAEFFVLQKIIEKLESNTGLRFENKETVLNLNNYEIAEVPFFGNLGSSLGKIYTGTDTFQYYFPTFNTLMRLENPSKNINREGPFEVVCMNGYRGETNPTYRVTDYMQWPSPYYKITNDMVTKNDVLVIGCSMSMRTMAYLSLLCHSVTVLDPRAFGSTDYLKMALESEYDAVIQFSSYDLLVGVGGYSADIQEYQVKPYPDNGKFDLYVTVKNDGTMSWTADDGIRMHLRKHGDDVRIRAYIGAEEIIEPGETYTFVFENMSSALAMYDLSVQMLKEGSFYFNENEPITEWNGISNHAFNAEIISNDAPKIINHSDSYKINIAVQNTGSIAWSENDQVRLCIWLDGVDWGFRVHLPHDVIIQPGESYVFTMDFNLPEKEMAKLEFQMLQEGIAYFGEREMAIVTATLSTNTPN